jgi:PhzF family phenazine biosynthesis protein
VSGGVTTIEGVEVLKYTAFAAQASGGNPAGVVLEPGDLSAEQMLKIAAVVGYSETAFLWPLESPGHYRIRYFAPEVEVTFCGHATIASGVALADAGVTRAMRFETLSGEVGVRVVREPDGTPVATLTSVAPSVRDAAPAIVAESLSALRWSNDDIDPVLPPRVVYAGATHLVFGVRSRELLAAMDYDFAAMRALMEREGWTTAQLVWREDPTTFHSRVPFPPGGVVEDPATGAAAAALGAYLRVLGLVELPARGHPARRRRHRRVRHRHRVTRRPPPLTFGMGEQGAIDAAGVPVTQAQLCDDLRMLGVEGLVLLVHSSLSSLGWVPGAAQAVVLALVEAVGPQGTIVMPTHSGTLTEPSRWANPPVPESWWPVIRAETPAYDALLTPTRGTSPASAAARTPMTHSPPLARGPPRSPTTTPCPTASARPRRWPGSTN